MKIFATVLSVIVFSIFSSPGWSANNNNVDPLIQNVVNHLKQDLPAMMEYGAHQRVVTKRLNEQGTPKRVEEKNLRTVWVQNKPRNELVNIICKDIDNKSGKTRRCYDVEKASYQDKSKPGKPGKIEAEIKKIRWTELHKNFHFALLATENEYQVISFTPKPDTCPTSRMEKLLSKMAGKVWIDKHFNIVKAEANLVDTVSFGLGVAAKVHQLTIQYDQNPHENVWLPSSLIVDFKAKVALIHTERRRIEVFWTSPYRKSDTVWAQVSGGPVSNASAKR